MPMRWHASTPARTDAGSFWQRDAFWHAVRLSLARQARERLATLFERGLVLYGKRADAARLLGRPEDLVPPRDRADPQWPDPRRDEPRQDHRPTRKRPRRRRRGTVWRPDIARLLEGAPRSEAVIAEQVLDDMASLVGLGNRQRRSLSFYKAFRAGQRFGDKLAGGARDSEDDIRSGQA